MTCSGSELIMFLFLPYLPHGNNAGTDKAVKVKETDDLTETPLAQIPRTCCITDFSIYFISLSSRNFLGTLFEEPVTGLKCEALLSS